MELSNIKLVWEGKEHILKVLNEYDGVKEAIDIENKVLLSWFDEKDKYEEWIIIKLDSDIIYRYLSQQIGLLGVIKYAQKKNSIFLARRYFKNYNSLTDIKKIGLDDIRDGLPLEDIPLDINIYEILNSKNQSKDNIQDIRLVNNYYEYNINNNIKNNIKHEYNQKYNFNKISNYQISTKSEIKYNEYNEGNNKSLMPIAA